MLTLKVLHYMDILPLFFNRPLPPTSNPGAYCTSRPATWDVSSYISAGSFVSSTSNWMTIKQWFLGWLGNDADRSIWFQYKMQLHIKSVRYNNTHYTTEIKFISDVLRWVVTVIYWDFWLQTEVLFLWPNLSSVSCWVILLSCMGFTFFHGLLLTCSLTRQMV